MNGSRVFLPGKAFYKPYIDYCLKLISQNSKLRFEYTEEATKAELVFDDSKQNAQPIATDFYQRLKNGDALNHEEILPKEPLIRDTHNQPDYLASIFYLVNCLQEHTVDEGSHDNLGRFKYNASLHKRFGIVSRNLVQQYIDTWLANNGLRGKSTSERRVFISHDIDDLYGSLKQDGFWALKKGRADIILSILLNEILQKPHWKNIDQVLKIQSEYDLKSTFFWIMSKQKGSHNVANADYSIEKEKGQTELVDGSGFTNGLHKSTLALTIDEELAKLPFDTTYNRYHYLKFRVPDDWQKISDSKLEMDASLGFAEHIGFRNSYGRPFQPFNLNTMKPYDFVEVPLNIMDRTIQKYMKLPLQKTADTIIEFMEKNGSDSLISILWHNKFFTQYKFGGYLKEYKKVLTYLVESNYTAVSPAEIVREYKLP